MPLAPGTKVVTLAFAVSGVIHLVRPKTFEPAMPAWVPAHREAILVSGVAELACAVGLNVPATRRLAGWASAALLLGIYPANVQMAIDAAKTDNTGLKAATIARLPLQIPLIRSALRAARS